MDALYAKLYDKYTKLKEKKFSEFNEIHKEQEEKFLNFVSASKALMQHLRNEKKNLQEIVENLRNEMTSIRSSRDDKCLEYQKLLMEEEQKNKALSEEVAKLKELLQEGNPSNYEDQSGRKQETKNPETPRVTTRSKRKRSRQSEDLVETDLVSPHISKHYEATETLLVSQPQCCKTTYDGSTSEALMQHLRNEKKNLQEIVENLRNEMTSIRSSRDDKCLEYQKLLMEEEQKNKALSEEVAKLKELLQEGNPSNYEDQSGRKQEKETPETPQVTTRSMRKRSRQSEDMVETDMVSPHISKHHEATETLLVSQPQCCKTTYDGSSNSASCTFQALTEHLLGMKLSTNNEGEHACIVASHPTSGLSFSLTLINNSTGEESELLYKVVSLGTFERVAPEWMKDVIKFSTTMCPVFFERVARVTKVHC